MLYLYLISQNVNDNYDTYDSAVVAAPSEHAAIHTHPSGYTDMKWVEARGGWGYENSKYGFDNSDWAPIGDIQVKKIGLAEIGIEAGVVCSSYNAG